MITCPTCDGHFIKRKYPNGTSFYQCGTRKYYPGTCDNALKLPVNLIETAVLNELEDKVLGTGFIEYLLSLVDGAEDPTPRLNAELKRLRAEVDRLVGSIAAGVPATSVAPAIQEREVDIARIEATLREPRVSMPDREQLRLALEQRTTKWRAILRSEPRVARELVRRVIGPLTLTPWEPDPSLSIEQVPEWVRGEVGKGTEAIEPEDVLCWDAPVRPEALLEGLVRADFTNRDAEF